MTIAHDKKLHFFVGFLICATGVIAGYATVGFVLSIAAGFAKEIWDWLHPKTHTADVLDFAATVLGGSAAYLLWIVFSRGI